MKTASLQRTISDLESALHTLKCGCGGRGCIITDHSKQGQGQYKRACSCTPAHVLRRLEWMHSDLEGAGGWEFGDETEGNHD